MSNDLPSLTVAGAEGGSVIKYKTILVSCSQLMIVMVER